MQKLISFASLSRGTIIIGFIFLGILFLLFRDVCLSIVGDFLIVQDNIHPAQVIHVIAGDDYRTDYAIHLYKQGFGKILFFTGGWCKFHKYYHGEHGQKLALAEGVPLDNIAFDESTVKSTYMEAERLREWIGRNPNPIDSVIVVSDPFHMRRARWAYRRVLGNSIEVQMAPVPFELTPYKHAWWRDQASRRYVREEYEKFFYYIMRYQISWGKFKEWLASLDIE